MPVLTHHSIEEDFAAWSDETADLLEKRRFDEVDLAALVEEVRGLGQNQLNAVQIQFERLLLHLMKWAHQTDKRSPSWARSILDARSKIDRRLQVSPSLRSKLTDDIVRRRWAYARRMASIETGLDVNVFPKESPWDLDTEVLNPDWLP